MGPVVGGRAEYEAIVIGGGPAGATTATCLAQRGRRILLLERERFPRYHIGESLMPYTWFSFERLGIVEQMERSAFPRKYSVQFVSTSGRVSQPFYFRDTIDHACAVTWQVLRSEFDRLLLANAREKGVEIRQGVAARELITRAGAAVGVRADVRGGGTETWHTKTVVDATGRETLLASKMGWKQRDPDLNKLALFTYFRGAVRDPGVDAGATTVAYLPDKGWFWYIPLPDDTVSVGVVAEHSYLYRQGRSPQTIFDREVGGCQWIRDHLRTGVQVGPVRVTGEFSYSSRQIGGDGFCLVGDAFSFLDPIFSSGVFLALKGGELAADAIDRGLESGAVTAQTFDTYASDIRYATDTIRTLVLAFYDKAFSFRDFVVQHPDLNDLLVDVLIGNVFKDLQPLMDALHTFSRRASSRVPVRLAGSS